MDDATGYIESNGIVKPTELQTWVYRSRMDLYPGDGFRLPGILITNITPLLTSTSVVQSTQIGSMILLAKVKNLPAGSIEFRPFFLPVSNEYSLKPVVVTGLKTNNRVGVFFPFPKIETNSLQE